MKRLSLAHAPRQVLCAAFAIAATILYCFAANAWAIDKITVATGADPGFAHFYVAKKGGFWEKRGLDVDVKLFPSGGAAFSSIVAGDAVAALGGGTGCILTANRSPKVVLAASSYTSDKFFGMVALSRIKSGSELKGKKVATAMGSDAESFAEEYFHRLGMTQTDVQLLNLDAPEMIAALDRGDIDAYTAWEPWLARAQEALKNKVHVLPGSTNFFTNNIWICVDREWAKSEQAQRFMLGLLDADKFIKTDPEAAAKLTAETLNVPVSVAKRIMDLVTFDIVINDQTTLAMQRTVGWLVAKGKIKPLNYSTFIYSDLLRKVKPEGVRFTMPAN